MGVLLARQLHLFPGMQPSTDRHLLPSPTALPEKTPGKQGTGGSDTSPGAEPSKPAITRGVKKPAPVRPALVAALLTCFAAPAGGANTDDVQSLRAIEHTAETYVAERSRRPGANVQVKAGPLDRRLKLPACGTTLQAFVPPGARLTGNATVGVRCTGPRPWKLYVPVRTAVLGPVVVASRHLAVGETVTANALSIEQRDTSPLRKGYLADTALAVGQTVKRAIPAGAVVVPSALKARTAIERGQSVTLSAAGSGLSIRMAGRAMADGAVGQRIPVRNLSSGQVVEGLVRSPELVEVLLD